MMYGTADRHKIVTFSPSLGHRSAFVDAVIPVRPHPSSVIDIPVMVPLIPTGIFAIDQSECWVNR